jgi:hypothetical protein
MSIEFFILDTKYLICYNLGYKYTTNLREYSMPNLRIIYDNAADRATITASASAGSLTASNLQNNKKSKVWRSPNSSARLDLSWASPELVKFVGVPRNSMSTTGSMRVRGSNETTASNLLNYSDQLDTIFYTKTGLSVDTTLSTAPDGTTSARRLIEDTANSTHYIQKNANLTIGVKYTLSMYVYPETRTRCRIANSTLGAAVIFDLPTKVITASGGTGYNDATITEANNGWYRISITFTPTSTGTFGHILHMVDNSNLTSYLGTSATLLSWGWQLEVGAVATSYYPSAQTFTSRASTSTYIDVNGLVADAATNIARMTYDYPSLATIPPRLLVELASTNLLPYTEGIAAQHALASGTTNATVSIQNFANSMQFTPFTSTIAAYHQTTPSTGTIYTYSVFVQMDDNSRPVVGSSTGAGDFSLVIQSVLYTGPVTITPLGGNIYRISATQAATISSNAYYGIAKYSTQSSKSFRKTGAQFEVGRAASSYIRNLSSGTVNRAADVFTSLTSVRPAGYMDWWQSYSYDSGIVPCVLNSLGSSKNVNEFSQGQGVYSRVWLNNSTSLNYLTIDFYDNNNSLGYLDASRLVVGTYWSPTYNTGFGLPKGSVDTTSNDRSEAGDLLTTRGIRYDTMSFEIPWMTVEDLTQFNYIRKLCGKTKPVYVSLFPEDSMPEKESSWQIYGNLTELEALTHNDPLLFSSSVSIEEF